MTYPAVANLMPLATLVATTVLSCLVSMMPESRRKRRLVNALSALCCAGFLAAALLVSAP